ncbi:MAG: hypothetical protein KC609_07155 [Myxococcales bacterium]|nr:hypothetical protein [Myxococcales bacterium]
MLSHGSSVRALESAGNTMAPALTELQRIVAERTRAAVLPRPRDVWEAFKHFAAKRFDCEDDALLLQCGQFGFNGREVFHVDFVRQFTIDSDYQRVEQLHCEFTFPMSTALQGRETFVWSYYSESLEDFFRRVESLPLWRILEPLVPRGFHLYLEAQ